MVAVWVSNVQDSRLRHTPGNRAECVHHDGQSRTISIALDRAPLGTCTVRPHAIWNGSRSPAESGASMQGCGWPNVCLNAIPPRQSVCSKPNPDGMPFRKSRSGLYTASFVCHEILALAGFAAFAGRAATPAKPSGRGLKHLREVPIHPVAQSLALPTHTLDTFTSWTPPTPINLIIAVSFGLLIPPRILSLATHGGLNVHPSLLPDLRGPAPIEHAILRGRERTGVSIQTLHPTRFDHGTVLAQTPAPGLAISRDATAARLGEELAAVGARMLVDVLRERMYLAPHRDVGWYAGSIAHAPKTTKQDRKLISADSMAEPWPKEPGLWLRHDIKNPVIRAKCGAVAIVASSTYPGTRKGGGNAKVMRMLSPNKASELEPEKRLEGEWERVDEH
ncbi:hypothetical protein SNOG_05294 [Parastagonospora nodorum SN15]|uniref:methionyl-tRNA formyltransferase n=1 Tax=Phaeosphaeria nodorum (strain SN15 / ATCC MYA-4574 / FGSC 10173) TaxID=321614 RepID=Q0USH0_PHANO|nr:hypothetical protein SNOG_05294 [Parastagonospora nodorum SN15]EAT87685.1 hypothetical protein SNOG_05294 [Parastagonospora nodorum SN15]